MVFAPHAMKGGMNATAWRQHLLILTLLLSLFTAGCTNPIGPPEPNAHLTVDMEQISEGGVVNFDGRESSTPEGTIITEYAWDFGDGTETTTSQGLTNHNFMTPGTYIVTLKVTNDQGGTDESQWSINVNAFPQVELIATELAKVGELITLDASNSIDPEGGVLTWMWDLNYANDSDGDGDPRNDVDSTESKIEILVNESGDFEGSVIVTDDKRASTSRYFSINVSTRTWQVTWEQQRHTAVWQGYLKQGESWSDSHLPGLEGRIIEMNATLTLEMDVLIHQMPQDNFTLRLAVPDSAWNEEQATRQENITKSPKAYIERDGMNPIPPESKTYQSDHQESLFAYLMNDPAARFGSGNWTWQVTADNADPDLWDGIDPDEGNNWELEVEFILLVPRIAEVYQ